MSDGSPVIPIVLAFTLGVAISPTASLLAARAAPQPEHTVHYIRVVKEVVVPTPPIQLATMTPTAMTIPGALINAPELTPWPPKPELPPRDEAEKKLLACVTPQMGALWDKIEEKFGRLKIVCTCDHSYYVAGTRRVSWHVSGNAIDFNVPPERRAEVLGWLAQHHTTGLTMTYNDSQHLHVDVGGYVHMALAGRDRALHIPRANAPARYVRARRQAVQYDSGDDDDSN